MLQSLINDFRRRTADESAASAIELAIVLPILLLAALALVDMAFFVVNWTGTNAGATSAARTIVVTPDATQADLKAAVLSDAPQLAASDFEVNVTWGEKKSQGYTHHFPNKTATEFVSKQRYVVTQDVTVTVTAKRPYLTVLGKAWGQNAGTGDDMVATSSCTMSVDRTNGTNWVGEDNYVPGIRWTLEDGVLTVMPEEGYSWGVGIKDGVTATGSDLADWVTLTSDEWKTVTEIDFEGSVAFGDSKGNRYCPRIHDTGAESTLVKADLSSWDSSKVTDMRRMFDNCSSLTTLDLSGWDTSNVASMGSMFYHCNSLTSLDLSNWDTSKVTDMYSMFDNCSSLTSLDLSNWDTSKVTDMSWMFYYCSSLTTLDVSYFDTSNVTDMDYMFRRCSKLTSLDLSNWDTSNVTKMGSMFYYCSSLTTICVGDEWSTDEVMSSSYMFYKDTKLVGAVSYNSSKVDASMANWKTGYLTYAQRQNGATFATKFAVQPAESREVSDVTKIALIERDGTEIDSSSAARGSCDGGTLTFTFQGAGPSYAKELGFAITCKMSDGNIVTYNTFDGIPEKVVAAYANKVSRGYYSKLYADKKYNDCALVSDSGLNIASFKIWPSQNKSTYVDFFVETVSENGLEMRFDLKVE